VSCGAAGISIGAGKLGCDVIAIDLQPDGIERTVAAMRTVPARSFRPIHSDCNPIPLPDGSASAVVVLEVMEHMDDPARFLAELVRVGKPDARYLISVPDPASEALMRVVAPARYFQKPVHQYVFERRQFADLVRGAGLAIEGRDYCNFYWSLWWVFRMASGTSYLPGQPGPPPIIAAWNEVWKALEALPKGAQVARALDRAIPKSQVVRARKVRQQAGVSSSPRRRTLRKARPSSLRPRGRSLDSDAAA
jgi:SAM-dependent methyltransferase